MPFSSVKKQKRIINFLGCNIGELPAKYLGMPLFMGILKVNFWDGVLNKIDNKLVGYKGKLLTYATMLLLTKNTLCSIPLYSACIFKMSMAVANDVDAKCRKFLWSDTYYQRKFSLVKWDIVCKEKMKGGLGLRQMKVLNQVLQGKLV